MATTKNPKSRSKQKGLKPGETSITFFLHEDLKESLKERVEASDEMSMSRLLRLGLKLLEQSDWRGVPGVAQLHMK